MFSRSFLLLSRNNLAFARSFKAVSRSFVLLFFLLSTTLVGKGQDLVPNGDFEGYSGCPTYVGQLDSALFWMNATTNISGVSGTPDYFNSCTFSSLIDVPDNYWGYQPTHSGQAYCGINLFYYATSDFREYIEGQFISPLIINSCYHFEMYINQANQNIYATDAIGIYFSDTAVTGIANWDPLPFTPQINNATGNYLTDTLNWVLFTSNYTAQGGENYFLIGNFKDDANTTAILTNSSGGHTGGYVYIDDVSLTPCTGINENIQNASIHISPNPVSNNLQISGTIQSSEAEINLTDVTGRICFHATVFSKGDFNVNINVNDFSDGIYILNVRDGGKMFSKKVVIRR